MDHEIIDDTDKNLLSRHAQYWYHNASVIYTHIKGHNPELLNKPEVQLFIIRTYKPESDIRGDAETTSDEIEQFLFSHIHMLPAGKLLEFFTYRATRNPKEIIQLAHNIDQLDVDKRTILWESILWGIIAWNIEDEAISKAIIKEIDSSLLKEIYDKKDTLWKAYIAHFSKKWFEQLAFIDQAEKENSGVTCFFASKQTLEDFQKFIGNNGSILFTSEQLLSIISNPEVLNSPKYQEYIKNYSFGWGSSENPFKEKIDKETQLSLIKNNYKHIAFFHSIFDISY